MGSVKNQPQNCCYAPDVDRWFLREKGVEGPLYWGKKKLREVLLLERMLHGSGRPYDFFEWKGVRRLQNQEIAEVERLFSSLADEWRNETAHISSIPRIVMHPAYQQIVGLGRPVIPLILKSMRQEPGYWFWALEMIARENPVPPESAGHTRQMKQAWLNWGKEQGLI